jgi:hypothetical protein
MLNYELAEYLLASLPPDQRAKTVESLRRANATEFRRMRTASINRTLGLPDTPATQTPKKPHRTCVEVSDGP